jgi:hypothetical protein
VAGIEQKAVSPNFLCQQTISIVTIFLPLFSGRSSVPIVRICKCFVVGLVSHHCGGKTGKVIGSLESLICSLTMPRAHLVRPQIDQVQDLSERLLVRTSPNKSDFYQQIQNFFSAVTHNDDAGREPQAALTPFVASLCFGHSGSVITGRQAPGPCIKRKI